MKKRILLSLVCLSLLVFVLSGVSYGWQGRMGGMGDPYGLLQDESDFLIHPSGIAKGEGITLYGDYRFTYRSVQDWDYNVDVFVAPVGPPALTSRYETSGDEQTHDVLVGAAIPLGPGRMGIFFEYTGMGGDYDGDVMYTGATLPSYDLSSDFDNFALRLLYGLPIGGFNLGGEVQFAYRQEENETDIMNAGLIGAAIVNGFYGSFSHPSDYYVNLFPFMTPYDSSYWEALLKGSLEGTIGPVETAFTLRGGFIFAGDNQLAYYSNNGMFLPGTLDLDGKVEGWRLGGDLWLGFSLGDGLSLPFLVRIDYQDKSKDGDGMGVAALPPIGFAYENEESRLELEVGGGVAKEFAGGTRLAGGIYYNYLDAANDFELTAPVANWLWNRSEYPDCTEHRFQVKLAGDFPLADAVALQFGMNFFYGWIKEDYAFNSQAPMPGLLTENVSLDGSHWGFGASMGTAVKLQRLTLEPFVGFGYQQINLEGDGLTSIFPAGRIEVDKATEEWLIGTGLSVQFDL
jgi:hypothetical protein